MNTTGENNKKYHKGIIKIGLVDDHQLFRAGLEALLKDHEDLKVVLHASNGKELLNQLKRVTPHVILLDIEMPVMDGIETTIALREKHPDIKIIILTMHDEDQLVFELINKGVHGFLLKDKSVEAVVDSIYNVVDKGMYFSEEVKASLLKGARGFVKPEGAGLNIPLTEREIEITQLVCMQKTSAEIAKLLNVSERTVQTHRLSIHNKTKTKNTAGLVLYALKHNLLKDFEF